MRRRAFINLLGGAARVAARSTRAADHCDTLRSVRESTPCWPSIGKLRDRLDEETRRVAECEWLAAGWRELIHRREVDDNDIVIGRDLLKTFHADLRGS
jgi:hypothetical protein